MTRGAKEFREVIPYSRRGAAVRWLNCALSLVWWALTAGGRLSRSGAVVLCYHGVRPEQRGRLARQFACIRGRAIGVAELSLMHGRIGRAPRVCLTFDDAFANLLNTAVPVARELQVPITVFAVSQNLGSRPAWEMPAGHPEADECVMTASDLREINGSHCRIGSHSATHRKLSSVSAAGAREELMSSRAELEAILGCGVEDFAFPHGAYTPELLAAARECGYSRAFTLVPVAHPSRLPRGVYGRFLVSPGMSMIEFRLAACGAYGWLDLSQRVRAWLRAKRHAPGQPTTAGLEPG